MVTQGTSATNRQFEEALARGDAAGCAPVLLPIGGEDDLMHAPPVVRQVIGVLKRISR